MNEAMNMDTVVTSLTTQLSASNLWGVVNSVMPYIGISVCFGLGFYLVKKAIRKTRNAKGGI